jgi:diamine N-acetyltransferase
MYKISEVELKPLNSIHVEFIYDLYNDPEVADYGFLGYSFPTSDIQIKSRLESWLTARDQKHFSIYHIEKVVGIAQIYNISSTSKKCNISILLETDSFGKRIGTKTLEMLVNICFNKINLHKIEVSIIENNKRSINMFEKYGFQKEGVLKDSIFKNGAYKDVYLYGLINKKNSN